ncbi:hypothetical protein SAMN02745121_03134 [Nannocystis exedens]|uniref:Uncharacterized protein n=1 Tax=Nannocystis exedens TaxID=54 RepID=A0A1I1Y382_9BACT|nr:hypothetical protein [Nannocystis exedens]PCC71782.1 ribulose-phosphate 3-epimerase [Nannocystis exedens]SFE14014.1 hypothetical protein SAMN02745121_03134 [Nannocystis exedens]
MPLRPLPLALLVACALRPPDDYQTSATGTTSAPATETAASGATTTAGEPTANSTAAPPLPTTSGPGPSTDGLDASATGDTVRLDQGPLWCDPWAEDCPAGEKCMPYADDGGGAWNSLKCALVAPDPDGVGEPCEAIGSAVSGEDTCDKHSMCWNVDPDTLAGTCVSFCDGSPDAPTCAPFKTTCHVWNSGVLNLCLPMCDPILQDCPNGDLCLPHPNESGFICVLDGGRGVGQAFDPCEYANVCEAGLSCVPPELASECDPEALGCCLPFCDLNAANTCPGQDQVCLPWPEEGPAEPGFEHVGICGLPMP